MNRFAIPTKLTTCIFALLCLASVGWASPQPSAEDNVHFCKVLDYEDMRARDSLYAARKQALNLNVGEPRTVRMIYFLPNDRPFRQEVVDSMKTTIRQIQTFFRDQMRANGYGDMTFRFETDAGGNPMVHRVDGQYSDSHYRDNVSGTVLDEVEQAFDLSANVYFILIDLIRPGDVPGVGGGGRNGGYGLVPSESPWTLAAHELGHAFGLWHNFNNNAYIMSYGGGRRWDLLSACHAEFLSVHPYFNPSIPDGDTPPPTVELISSPLYPAGSKNVSVRFRASDPDGLHQVTLFVSTRGPHPAAGSFEVKACRGLNGERDAVVQFNYDGVIPSDGKTSLLNLDDYWISLEAVDIFGNVGRTTLEVTCGNCPITLAKISGDNQQGVSGEALTNPFVVEVRDKNGVGLAGFPVRFTVTAGDGKLSGRFSGENATTDANGRVQSTLTLGDLPGTNTVEASVAGLKVAFNAVGVGTPPTGSDYQTWHLPEGAIARLGKGSIEEVAFSPDGSLLAVASGIGIWFYDVATSRELALLTGHRREVNSVSFSPDGRILASGSRDNTVKLWDVATRQIIATLEGHWGWVESVSFSPDGSTLASGLEDGTVKLWDVATRRNIATLEGHSSWITSVSFSPDGSTLASLGFDGTVLLWDVATRDVATRQNIATLEGYRDNVNSVSFSPDSRTFALGSDQEVKLWDVATRQNIATLTGHRDWVNSVSFSPDSRTLASGSDDNTVKLWDVTTRQNIATLEGHLGWVESVSFSPDGSTLASGAWDGTIKLWDVSTRRNIATLEGHSDPVTSVSFSPDGSTLASLGFDGTVLLWDVATRDVATRRNIATLEGHSDPVTSVSFSPDGSTLASGSWDDTVKLWDVATRRNIAMLEGHTGSVYSVSFSPDSNTLASGAGVLKLWDVTTRRNIATLEGHSDLVYSVSFSPDGSTLASGAWDDNTVILWDVTTRRNIATLEGHTDWVNSVSFSPDSNTLASGARDNTVKLWDVSTRQNIATLEGHTYGVSSVSFSPDGSTLASGSYDATVKLWDVATRRNIATLEGHSDPVESVSFSPDGSTLASGDSWGDGTVKLWDVATRQNIATLEGHSSGITSVSFSPDSNTLASGSEDGTVLLWDMSPYITPLPSLPPAVLTPDFNGDGRVDFTDFLLFTAQYGLGQGNPGYDARYDLDGDDKIGFGDFLIFSSAFDREGS